MYAVCERWSTLHDPFHWLILQNTSWIALRALLSDNAWEWCVLLTFIKGDCTVTEAEEEGVGPGVCDTVGYDR